MIVSHNGKQYDTSKLPQWAQELVAYQQRMLENLSMELERKIVQTETTNTLLDWSPMGKVQHYLPDNSRITFQLREPDYRGYIEVYRNYHNPSELVLHGANELVIHPQVSNEIRISLEDYK